MSDLSFAFEELCTYFIRHAVPGSGGAEPVEEREGFPNSSKSSSFEIAGLRIETRGNYSRCPKCKKDIKSTFIIRHIKLHDVPIERYECPEKGCGLQVNRINNLFRHLKVVHKSQKPYICKYCKKRYSRAEELRTHFAGHKAERERHRRTEKLDKVEDDGCVMKWPRDDSPTTEFFGASDVLSST